MFIIGEVVLIQSLPTYMSTEGLQFAGFCGCSVELYLCVSLNVEQNSAEEVLVLALSPRVK